jgi:Flp pilus assembly protein TadD
VEVAVPRKPTAFLLDSHQALERAEREFEQGHLKEAIEMLEHVLTMGTDSAPIRTMLGIACARTRQVERAFEHLERAVAFDTEAFGPRCALGELYMRLGVPEPAREHLDRALEVATSAQERAYVQSLLREERARDKRRVYRPNFRATRSFLRSWWRRT